MSPAIIIPIFQKAQSLQRLLDSLSRAEYGKHQPILVFSVESGASEEVKKIAEQFHWAFGEKRIRYRSGKTSLDAHILECADLSLELGKIILLEDDCFVAASFYQYAVHTSDIYGGTDEIAQISLYSYPFNELNSYPFIPLPSSSDVYLLRKPCSRGQLWTGAQWKLFRDYMEKHQREYLEFRDLPPRILKWDLNNWERMFSWYLVKSGRYALYPYKSLTTMFGDLGVHVKELKSRHSFQVPLFAGAAEMNYARFEDIGVRYDEYFEPDADILKQSSKLLQPYSFNVDLHGSKPLNALKHPLTLTSRKAKTSILHFGRELKPVEANIIAELPGHELILAETNKLLLNEGMWSKRRRRKLDLLYYYPEYPRRF